jgi:hypothetical protein
MHRMQHIDRDECRHGSYVMCKKCPVLFEWWCRLDMSAVVNSQPAGRWGRDGSLRRVVSCRDVPCSMNCRFVAY